MLILSGRYIGFLPRHIGESYASRGLMRALRPDTYGFESQHFAAIRKSEAAAPADPRLPARAQAPGADGERTGERLSPPPAHGHKNAMVCLSYGPSMSHSKAAGLLRGSRRRGFHLARNLRFEATKAKNSAA